MLGFEGGGNSPRGRGAAGPRPPGAAPPTVPSGYSARRTRVCGESATARNAFAGYDHGLQNRAHELQLGFFDALKSGKKVRSTAEDVKQILINLDQNWWWLRQGTT